MPKKDILQFSIPYLQILDEAGKVDTKLEPEIEPDTLLRIYRYMQLARKADDRMLKLQRQGRIGTFGPSTGQEAISVTAAVLMKKDDWFAGAFRELGGRLVRGEKIQNELVFYNGFEEGNVMPDETGGKLLPINIIIATQLLQATGIAYAMKYRGEENAVVAFMGDGATSEGDFHEALNFASTWQVPVVFISQNNQWAISVPREKQTHSRTLAQKGLAYDMPSIQVDGNDVLGMYTAISEALDRAYRGEGPTFIEAVTYRLMMHTTADDPKKYRTEEEEQKWWDKEPIGRFRKYLEAKGLWDDEKETALDAELKAEIDAQVKVFEERDDYAPDAPFEHVYGTPHPEIDKQRQEFLGLIEKEATDA